jgi:hypothetical protein
VKKSNKVTSSTQVVTDVAKAAKTVSSPQADKTIGAKEHQPQAE